MKTNYIWWTKKSTLMTEKCSQWTRNYFMSHLISKNSPFFPVDWSYRDQLNNVMRSKMDQNDRLGFHCLLRKIKPGLSNFLNINNKFQGYIKVEFSILQIQVPQLSLARESPACIETFFWKKLPLYCIDVTVGEI